MTEASRIRKIVYEIPYPTLVVGSGVMVMHGMDRKLGDLDLFIATRHWLAFHEDITFDSAWEIITTDPDDLGRRFDPPYLERYVDGLKVNIFFAWRVRDNEGGNLDVNRLWQEAELVDGVTCSPIKNLLEWKQSVKREKDLADIKAILERYPELDKQ